MHLLKDHCWRVELKRLMHPFLFWLTTIEPLVVFLILVWAIASLITSLGTKRMWGNFLCRIRQFIYISWKIPRFKIFFRMVCIILVIYCWGFSGKISVHVVVEFSLQVTSAVEFSWTLTWSKKTNLIETSNYKHDWTPTKYLSVLHHDRTQQLVWHFFLNIHQNITNFLFWVLRKFLATSINSNNANLQKLWCLSTCKIWNPSLTCFWDIA